MKILKMSVKNLHNSYDYDVSFVSGQEAFIITGPNGYGKTTILEIINNLSPTRFLYYYRLQFDSIEIIFDNKEQLHISKSEKSREAEDDTDEEYEVEMYFSITEESGAVLSELTIKKEDIDDAFHTFHDRNRLKNGVTIQEKINKLEENDIFDRYIVLIKTNNQFGMLLNDFRCSYFPANRINKIVGVRAGEVKDTLQEVLRDFANRLSAEKIDFLTKSQHLDELLIEKLIEGDENPKEIYNREKYERLEKKYNNRVNKLKEYGIIENLKVRPYNENKSWISSLDISTVGKKLDICKEIEEKLDSFKKMLVRKKFANKEIFFSSKEGIEFIDSISKNKIDIDRLSSGEKNEIYLLYRLIFEVKKDSILLIDEPENSLHVVWQREFVDDFEEVAKTNNIQIIIATHSPQIINGRKNCFDLYSSNMKRKNEKK